MARNFLNKVALEEENLATTDAVEAGAGADSAETSIIEANDSTAEVDTASSEIEEGVADIEVLEDLEADVGATLADGGDGLSEDAAAVLQTAVESYTNKYRKGDKLFKGSLKLEGFASASTRRKQTVLAMESISDKIRDIFRMIVAALTKFKDMIVNGFNKIFGAAEKLEKRAQALAKRAEDTKGTAKEKKIETSVADKLKIGGNATNIKPGIDSLGELIKSTLAASPFSTFEAVMETVIDDAGKAKDKPEEYIANFKTTSVVHSTMSLKTVSDPSSIGHSPAPDGLVFLRSDELPGGKALVGVDIPNGNGVQGDGAGKLYRQCRLGIDKFDGKNNKEVTELGVLSIGDAGAVAEIVADIAGNLKTFRNSMSKLSRTQDKAVKAAKDLESAASKETDQPKVKGLLEAGKNCQKAIQLSVAFPSSLASYALNTSKSALDAVELSLKQYSEQK